MMIQNTSTEKAVFLIRHAESVRIDRQRRYLGQQDIDLSPCGIRQAEMLSQTFRHSPIQAVFTSDLLRAIRTASSIARDHRCQPERVAEFREIDLGKWEARTFREIQAQYPAEYAQRGRDIVNYRTPGGESFADLQKRVLPAFTKVVDSTNGDLVIVAHAGVNRVILCHLMQRPLEDIFSIPQDYAAVNILRVNMGNYRVAAVNMDSDNLMSCLDMRLQ